jgi:5-formyltetrahydrofolate cyclo-ligase
MAVPSPSPGKSELRAEALARRRAFADSLTDELRAAQEQALARLVLPHLAFARAIGLYHPLRAEISPLPLAAMLGEGQRWGLPWFADRDARMIWRQGPAAEASPWGVLQPSADAGALSPDIVIVPLVLADRSGTRIGHGKGHYDRALAHLRDSGPVRTIGVGWDWQLVDEPIPADPWDVPLDAVATPKEFISCA